MINLTAHEAGALRALRRFINDAEPYRKQPRPDDKEGMLVKSHWLSDAELRAAYSLEGQAAGVNRRLLALRVQPIPYHFIRLPSAATKGRKGNE